MKDEVFVYYTSEIDAVVEVMNEKAAQTLADMVNPVGYIVFITTNEELNAYYGAE